MKKIGYVGTIIVTFLAVEWADLPSAWAIALTALAVAAVGEVADATNRQPLAAKSPLVAPAGLLLLVVLWPVLERADFYSWSLQYGIEAVAGWIIFILPLCRRPRERVKSTRVPDPEDLMMSGWVPAEFVLGLLHCIGAADPTEEPEPAADPTEESEPASDTAPSAEPDDNDGIWVVSRRF